MSRNFDRKVTGQIIGAIWAERPHVVVINESGGGQIRTPRLWGLFRLTRRVLERTVGPKRSRQMLRHWPYTPPHLP